MCERRSICAARYLLLQLLAIKRCEGEKTTVDGNVLRRDDLAVVVADLGRDLDELTRGRLILAALQLAETGDNLQLRCGECVLVGGLLGFGYIVVNMGEVVELDRDLAKALRRTLAPRLSLGRTLMTLRHICKTCFDVAQ